MLAPKPTNQAERIAALRRYDLGTKAYEGAFDGIVELAAQVTDCPISLVSIVHEMDQKFEARCGFGPESTGLDQSICSYTILQDEILEIPDTRLDARTADNPLVTQAEDAVRFYAGAQIVAKSGVTLGALCVLDTRPRKLSERERKNLRILADQVMHRLELHESLRQQDALRREVDHRVKNSLAGVAAMTRLSARGASDEVRAALQDVEQRINVMVELHSDLYRADDPDAPIEVSGYLQRITSHLQLMTPPGVEILAELDPIALGNRRATALGVLVNELVSNACKHAFPDGREGRILLRGRTARNGLYALTCEDDGIGLVEEGNGLGQQIVEASAAQLEGSIRIMPRDVGYRAELEFPVHAS